MVVLLMYINIVALVGCSIILDSRFMILLSTLRGVIAFD